MVERKQNKKRTFGVKEQLLFFAALAGALLAVIAALPPMPWRYARNDPNIGMRFSADRRYSLFSASNHYSQDISYMKYRTRMCSKMREFSAMSPMAAIAGVVSAELKTGGAVAGCGAWKSCIDHVAARCAGYGKIAGAGIFAFCMLIIGTLCAVASVVLLYQEPPPKKTAKSKAASEDAKYKTMTASVAAFLCVSVGVAAFNFTFVGVLDDFRYTGYYPWPNAHFGTFFACGSCTLLFISAVSGITRVYSLSDLRSPGGSPEAGDDEDEQQYEYAAQQGAHLTGPGQGFAPGGAGAAPWGSAQF